MIFKCPNCSIEHEQRNFLKHFRRVHGGVPEGFESLMKYPCDQCTQSFVKPYGLFQHKNLHHPVENLPENFHCHLCNTNHDYKTPGLLIQHYREEHGGTMPPMLEGTTKYICSQCPNIYTNEKTLKAHVRHKHTKKLVKNNGASAKITCKCTYCGKSFTNRGTLSKHVQMLHENSGAFECEICNRKFPSVSKLKDHVNIVHTKVSCELCNEVLYNKFYMKRHKAAVHGIIPQGSFKCRSCPMFFKAEKSLISHVKTKH